MGKIMEAILFLAITATVAMAAASPSPTAVDCSSVIYDMTDCLDYVAKGSKVSKPTKSCCTGLVSVVKVSPLCLCEGLDMAASMGIAIDVAKSTGLPAACGVTISGGEEQCTASPTSSPAASPKHTPSAPPKSSGVPTLPPPKSSSAPVTNGPAPSPADHMTPSGSSSVCSSVVSKIWLFGLVGLLF